MARSRTLLVVAVGLAAACAAPPPPLALPAVAVAVRYGRCEPAAAESSSPQRLHIQVLALRAPVAGTSVDVAAKVIASEYGQPFLGAAPLPPGSRWLTGDLLQQWIANMRQLGPEHQQLLGEAEAVLAPGLRTRLSAPSTPLPLLSFEHLAIRQGALDLSLQPADDAGRIADIHLGDPFPVGPAMLFVATADRDFAGFAWLLTPRGAADAESEAQAAAAAEPPAAPPTGVSSAWRVAMTSVGQHNRRPALLALAEQLHLPRCVDVLLVADERALADITQGLAVLTPEEAALDWPFERALWTALLPRLDRDELPGALHAALLRHLGALAGDSTTLRSVLTAAADRPGFETLVREENLAALDDHGAAPRVRGHDWLAARGAAVDGYRPLAPPEVRREALRKRAEAILQQDGAR